MGLQRGAGELYNDRDAMDEEAANCDDHGLVMADGKDSWVVRVKPTLIGIAFCLGGMRVTELLCGEV